MWGCKLENSIRQSSCVLENLRVYSEIFARARVRVCVCVCVCALGNPLPTAGYEQRMFLYLETLKVQENEYWTKKRMLDFASKFCSKRFPL